LGGTVYIVTNKKNGVPYIGVTNNIARRIWEHKSGDIKGFTKRYNLDKLVWYEGLTDITQAIQREKQIKEWKRDWKIQLIETSNPDWNDLYEVLNS
jgi:putative endonuclease